MMNLHSLYYDEGRRTTVLTPKQVMYREMYEGFLDSGMDHDVACAALHANMIADGETDMTLDDAVETKFFKWLRGTL